MKSAPALILDSATPLAEAYARIQSLSDTSFLVRMAPTGWNLLDRDDLDRMLKEGKNDLTLGSVLPVQQLPILYPDLPLDTAVRPANQFAMIPVVNRANLSHLEGIITRETVLASYNAASSPGE